MTIKPFQKHLSFALGILSITLFLVFFFPSILQYICAILSYPFDWDPHEGLSVFAALEIQNGIMPYAEAFSFPFTTYNYPPLYPALLALFFQGPEHTLMAGRLLSILALFGVLTLLVIFLQDLGVKRWIACLAPLLVLSTKDTILWTPLCRTDILAIFFLFMGLFLLKKASTSKSSFSFIHLSGMLMILASTLTKHVMLPFLFASFLIGFLTPGKRYPTLMTFLFSLAAFLWLLQQNMFAAMVGSRLEDLNLMRTWTFIRGTFLDYPILSLGIIGLFFLIKKEGLKSWNSLFLIFCMSFLLICGHIGSSINYLIPPILALSMGLIVFPQCLPFSEKTKTLMVTTLIFLHLVVSIRGLTLPIPDAAHVKKLWTLVDVLKDASSNPLVDERPMLNLYAGIQPQADLDATRDRFRMRYGTQWKEELRLHLQDQTPYSFILAGNRLGAFYPGLMKGLIPTGELFDQHWYGTERLVIFVPRSERSLIQKACRMHLENTPFCESF